MMSEVDAGDLRVEVVGGLERPQGALRVAGRPGAGGRAGARSRRWRARGRPPARARRAPPVACRGPARSPPARTAGRSTAGCALVAIWAIDAAASGWPASSRSNAVSPACTARTGWNAVQAAAIAIASTSAAARPCSGGTPWRSAAAGWRAARSAAAAAGRGLEPRAQRPAAGDPAGASSAGTALAGTNHVQSRAECTPKTITTTASVSIPTRSASYGSPRSRRRMPVARAAAASHANAASSDSAEARPSRGRRASARRSRARGGRPARRCGSACGASRRRPRRCRATGSLAWTLIASSQ